MNIAIAERLLLAKGTKQPAYQESVGTEGWRVKSRLLRFRQQIFLAIKGSCRCSLQ